MPITIACDGYNGDVMTNDVFHRYFNLGSDDVVIPDGIKYFGPATKEEDGPFFRPTRKNVDCKNRSQVQVEKKDKGKTQEELDMDPDKMIESPDQPWLTRLFASGLPMQYTTGVGPKFIAFNYNLVTANQFADYEGIRVIDFSTYNTLYKEQKSQLGKYVFVVPSSFSQTIVAFPLKYARTKEVGRLMRKNQTNKDTCILNADYLLMWSGISKQFPVVASATYAASVLLAHKNGIDGIDINELIVVVGDLIASLPAPKGKKSLVPSANMVTLLVGYMYYQEIHRRRMYPFSAVKLGSSYAYSAYTALTESDVGFISYEQEIVEFSDSEDDQQLEETSSIQTVKKSRDKFESKKGEKARRRREQRRLKSAELQADEGSSRVEPND
jgi:hypothetical protein